MSASTSTLNPKEDKDANERYDRLQNESELARLQKQYRDSEREYSMYKEEIKKKELRNSKEIVLLEKENEELKTRLENAEADCYTKKDEKTLNSIHTKLDEDKQVTEKIKEERAKIEEGKKEVAKMEKKIRDYRKGVAGLSGGNTKKKATQTEGRLAKATKEFSIKLEGNKKLREDIEKLRLDQMKYENMRKKMADERTRLKDEIREEEDRCKVAFRQREDYVVKRRGVVEKNEQEKQQFVVEKVNLERLITHDENFRKFVATKSRSIEHRQVEAEQYRREKELNARRESAQAQLDEYDEAFERLAAVTGEDDVEVIVDHFLQLDSDMFSTYNYVGQLELQVGQLQYQLDELEEKKVAYQEDLASREGARQDQLAQLDARHEEARRENEQLDDQVTLANKRLEEVLARAQESYIRLSEKDDALVHLLDDHGGQVTYRNALLFLAELERRADMLLSAQAYVDGQKKEGTEKKHKLEIETAAKELLPPATPDGFIENTPDYRSDSDDDGYDLQPLTADELKRRLMISMYS